MNCKAQQKRINILDDPFASDSDTDPDSHSDDSDSKCAL